MQGRSSPKVLFAGHISLDITPDLSQVTGGFQVFRPGGLILVDGVRFTTGGAVLNTGLALHRLGTSVRLLMHTGTDPYGHVLDELVKDSLSSDSNTRAGHPHSEVILTKCPGEETSSTIVFSPKDADRMFLCCPGTNRSFQLSYVTDDALNGIELFHFGYPPLLEKVYVDGGASLADMMASLQQRGIVTSLDMCMPDLQGDAGRIGWRSFLSKVLPYVDVFMPSFEELFFMLNSCSSSSSPRSSMSITPAAEPEISENVLLEMAQALIDMGARIVGIKLGDRGLYLLTGQLQPYESRSGQGDDVDLAYKHRPSWWQELSGAQWNHRELYIPCFQTQVVGTTGAGDSTIAGFLSGLLHSLSPQKCMMCAVAVGACSVEQMDATSGVPSWTQVRWRLEQGWPTLMPTAALSSWTVENGLHYGPLDAKFRQSSEVHE